MKNFQKLAITAAIIVVVLVIFAFFNGQILTILQGIVQWIFVDLFGAPSAPNIFV